MRKVLHNKDGLGQDEENNGRRKEKRNRTRLGLDLWSNFLERGCKRKHRKMILKKVHLKFCKKSSSGTSVA